MIKKLDIANVKEHDPSIDYMAAVKDGHLKEILAKEILTYDPPKTEISVSPVSHGKLENLMKVRYQSIFAPLLLISPSNQKIVSTF